jgi:DNA repair protein RecN (Recombination protein N)
LEIVEDRLALIHRLEKKYGSTVADVLEYGKEAREQLAGLENWETDKEKLEIEIKKLEKDVFAAARELSEKRESTADVLEKKIADALQSLGMEKSEFRISVKQKESEKGSPICGSKGFDRVAFLISPNRGEPLKPLRTTASGGEISRVMLAIKTVLSQSDRIQTLIFDEIDVGIGGEVAVSVGEHLTNLSEFKQILCITHLASIAARADNHIKVEKNFSGKRTVTEVQNITGRARVSEIARMLAGDKTGEASLSHAEELLRKHGPGEY